MTLILKPDVIKGLNAVFDILKLIYSRFETTVAALSSPQAAEANDHKTPEGDGELQTVDIAHESSFNIHTLT